MDNTNLLYPTSISNLFPEATIKDWMNKGNANIFHMHEDGKACIVGILSKGDFIHMLDIFTEKIVRF